MTAAVFELVRSGDKGKRFFVFPARFHHIPSDRKVSGKRTMLPWKMWVEEAFQVVRSPAHVCDKSSCRGCVFQLSARS